MDGNKKKKNSISKYLLKWIYSMAEANTDFYL